MVGKRLKNVDILKVLGLLGIIIAHANPPSWMIQLRGFDVVLLMVVSVYLYFSKPKEEKILSYVWKRIKRLIFPTYIFLAMFFLMALIIKPYPFSISKIFDSFMLHDGIGYVWIIRIYLIVALLLPLTKRLLKPKWINWCFFGIVGLCIIQELLYRFGIFSWGGIIVKDYIAYVLPCLAIVLWTYWMMNANKRQLIIGTLSATIICAVLMCYYASITGKFQITNIAKYPFRGYYIAYALAVTGWLFFILKNNRITNGMWNKGIEFISTHSLWIYFWHIPLVFVIEAKMMTLFWLWKTLILFGGACLVVAVQNFVIKRIEKKIAPKKSELLKLFNG